MKVLVIGAYGLIGSAVVRRFHDAGHDVVCFGRSPAKALEAHPDLDWRYADLVDLSTAESWNSFLTGMDIVVNASGVLQDGFSDNVEQAQAIAICALAEAADRLHLRRLIQISAPGARANSTTLFYSSKAQADAKVASSRTPSTILRPGLVIGPQSYGGTRLLRMLAAVPIVQPIATPNSKIQTISLEDVAEAALIAATEGVDGDFDLMETRPHTLESLVLQFRHWLGFPKPLAVLVAPSFLTHGVALLADALGWLGWRSPLRTTAMKVLKDNVLGDATAWNHVSGMRLSSLEKTLKQMPSTFQERTAARVTLVFPILLVTLSLFWLASGIIGAWQFQRAAAILPDSFAPTLKALAVYGGAIVDVLIGLMLMFKPTVRLALKGSLAVCLVYLIGGGLLAPELWKDPLGPMVKVFPAMGLSLAVLALFRER